MAKKSNKNKCISKYITLIISILSLFISIYNSLQSNVFQKREVLVISNVLEDEYFFDGINIFKSVSIVISNNSEKTVSIIDIALKRESQNFKFNYNNLQDLPLNMPSNSSTVVNLNLQITIEDDKKKKILDAFGKNCYIDSYVLETFLLDNIIIKNENTIDINPSIELTIKTSKDNYFTFKKIGGASASF